MNVFKTRYNYDPSVDAGVECTLAERRTKSEFADECDINRIVARYKKTGILPDQSKAALARYLDVSEVPSYSQMHDLVVSAHDAFASLPAKVRREFDNDPIAFMEASQSPEGRELLKSLGLGPEKAPTPPEASAGAPAGGQPASQAPESQPNAPQQAPAPTKTGG